MRRSEMRRRTGAMVAAAACVFAAAATVAGAGQLAGPSFTEAGQFGTLQLARGLESSSDGTLFAADSNNHRLQVFSSSGASTGGWGGFGPGSGKLSGPRDVDIAPDGNIWVADYNNSRLQEFRPDGSFVRAINQSLLTPGVAVDAAGNVWASRSGGNGAGTIVKHDRASNFAPSTSWGGLSYPGELEISPDGSVYVSNEGTNRRVVRFDQTGKELASFAVGPSNPIAIAVDLDCNLWVGDVASRRLVKHSPSGQQLGELKPKTETAPYAIDVGPTGNLYVINLGRNILRLNEDRKPGVAAVPGRIAATKSGKAVVAKVRYALSGIACPAEVGATASVVGKGLSGKAAGLTLPAGKVTTIEIPLKGKALAQKGRTVPATFSIVLQTNGRSTTEAKKITVGIPK
jgi:sugar lactone lactonase YvrE